MQVHVWYKGVYFSYKPTLEVSGCTNLLMFKSECSPEMIIIFRFLLVLTLSSSVSYAQQRYSGNAVLDCNNSDRAGPSPAFLYTCNARPSCRAFLLFKPEPPYTSVPSISNLTSSDPLHFARLNNVSTSSFLPPETDVFVPVDCSCLGKYYQANASYVIPSEYDYYFTIANYTYEGLTTCDSLMRQNPYGKLDLLPGLKLNVPLRCACPTQEQVEKGTEFLLTYLISPGDTLYQISNRFNVAVESVCIANGFRNEDEEIYPFTTILIPLPTEPSVPQMKKPSPKVPQKKHNWLYLGTGVGASLSVVCFLLLLCFLHYRRRKITEASWKDRLPEHFLDKVNGIGETLKVYTYEELVIATHNFSPEQRLSNSVYLGKIRGKLLAVKKTSKDVSKEIKILGNVNHFNLIRLYGYCEHDGVFYLVYEYLEEGSLKEWLSKENFPNACSWNHRILIALDVAHGLDYLHSFTSPAYVHKDINSCNILLSKDLRAKIANFGLAREDGNSGTSCVVGERGYMAPEYIRAGEVTPKIDVYAFGVVLLELITGRDAVCLHDGREVTLTEKLISVMDGTCVEELHSLTDHRLQEKHPLGYVIDRSELTLRLLRLSAACLATEPSSRLSMAQVVTALMKIQLDIYNPQSFTVE